jgi:hypothetical protein
MSRRPRGTVSEIVEKYRGKYPRTERKVLRRLILLQHKDINPRTLDRHLKKVFKTDTSEKARGQKLQYLSDQPVSLWDMLLLRLQGAGAPPIDLKIEKLELSDKRDPITGWYEVRYDKLLPVQGVIILKGAKELEAAASLHVPKDCLGVLLTQGKVEDGDRFLWRDKQYVIQEVEEVIDGYELGYRIAKLVARYHQP